MRLHGGDKKLNHGSFQGAREGSDASQKLDRNGLPGSELENFNYPVFALAFFSRRQDRELLGWGFGLCCTVLCGVSAQAQRASATAAKAGIVNALCFRFMLISLPVTPYSTA